MNQQPHFLLWYAYSHSQFSLLSKVGLHYATYRIETFFAVDDLRPLPLSADQDVFSKKYDSDITVGIMKNVKFANRDVLSGVE